MPIAAALPAIIGGAGALAAGIGGATNPRPPSLDRTQSSTLDALLKQLYGTVGTTPTIDPVQRALMFGNIAQEGTAGANRATNALTSRGLGRSGLLAQALNQNSSGIQAAQNNTDLGLQQQAISQRNTTIQQILGLLGVTNVPGQSGVSGFFSGAGSALGPLAYALAKGGSNKLNASQRKLQHPVQPRSATRPNHQRADSRRTASRICRKESGKTNRTGNAARPE
jgi:hypothetical protein